MFLKIHVAEAVSVILLFFFEMVNVVLSITLEATKSVSLHLQKPYTFSILIISTKLEVKNVWY